MIRRSTKKERQRNPEITEAGTWSQIDQGCLYQDRFCDRKLAVVQRLFQYVKSPFFEG